MKWSALNHFFMLCLYLYLILCLYFIAQHFLTLQNVFDVFDDRGSFPYLLFLHLSSEKWVTTVNGAAVRSCGGFLLPVSLLLSVAASSPLPNKGGYCRVFSPRQQVPSSCPEPETEPELCQLASLQKGLMRLVRFLLSQIRKSAVN